MRSPIIECKDSDRAALDVGFFQCVYALRRTLATTPLGWILVVWLCWGVVPKTQIALWLTVFILIWILSLSILQWIIKVGPDFHRHTYLLLGVASLDGVAWGLSVWLLMGYDPILDPWLAAVLCGVSAVNAPVYITHIRGYFALISSLWLVALLALAFNTNRTNALSTAFGLSVFFCLIAYYMHSIAQRVIEGIRLQHANASLAEKLQETLQLVKLDASTDALTGLANRRALNELLEQQIQVTQKGGDSFSVLMIDIDYFKQINDTYGHDIGDDTLRAFAFRVRNYLHQSDICARYGGEEFVVVLLCTSFETAFEIAERLRTEIAETDLLTEPRIKITVSIGVATYVDGQTIDDLIKTVDKAVYIAKRGGRNQVRSLEAMN